MTDVYKRQLRGHLAGARARAGVDKPGSPPVEEQQIVQQSRAVFDKAGVVQRLSLIHICCEVARMLFRMLDRAELLV